MWLFLTWSKVKNSNKSDLQSSPMYYLLSCNWTIILHYCKSLVLKQSVYCLHTNSKVKSQLKESGFGHYHQKTQAYMELFVPQCPAVIGDLSLKIFPYTDMNKNIMVHFNPSDSLFFYKLIISIQTNLFYRIRSE